MMTRPLEVVAESAGVVASGTRDVALVVRYDAAEVSTVDAVIQRHT